MLVLAVVGAGISAIDMVLRKQSGQPKATLWIAPAIAWGVLVVGWVFIFWQNNFHVTAPVVMVSLAYLAVVATVYNLFRTGAAAVARNEEDDGGASWGKPIGARGELEREKKTLLKAIKEAEFDQQMGKLSKADAEQMILTIRARAIEVIKEIEQLDAGAAGSARDRIEREVKARLEISAAVDRKAAAVEKKREDKAKGKKGKGGAVKADDAKADAAHARADDAKADKAEKSDEDNKAAGKSRAAGNGDANHADQADAKTEGDAMPDPVASTSDAQEARS
jgi:hypothetical protein